MVPAPVPPNAPPVGPGPGANPPWAQIMAQLNNQTQQLNHLVNLTTQMNARLVNVEARVNDMDSMAIRVRFSGNY